MNYVKPPKSQNILTSLIGQKKRFNSKEFRESKETNKKAIVRRSIQIMPFKEIKKKLQTFSDRNSISPLNSNIKTSKNLNKFYETSNQMKREHSKTMIEK